MTINDIIHKLKIKKKDIVGNGNNIIIGIVPLSMANQYQLTFCKKGNEPKLVNLKNCTIIISKTTDISNLPKDNTYILVDNPRLVFIRAMTLFYPQTFEKGINNLSYIHPSAKISSSAYIGPFVYIGPNCIIKENTIIYPNVSIIINTTICENVIIFPNCTIGGDGFGYERNENNELEKFPHIGGVYIDKNVDIGSNTAIDRGSISNTEIGEGTKIDNLVHIAHNVKIGKHCEIIANSMIGGSVIIGDYTRIAPGAQIMNGIKIGKNVVVGLGAVVTKDIPDNTTVAGTPAREINEFKKYLKFIKDNIKME